MIRDSQISAARIQATAVNNEIKSAVVIERRKSDRIQVRNGETPTQVSLCGWGRRDGRQCELFIENLKQSFIMSQDSF